MTTHTEDCKYYCSQRVSGLTTCSQTNTNTNRELHGFYMISELIQKYCTLNDTKHTVTDAKY